MPDDDGRCLIAVGFLLFFFLFSISISIFFSFQSRAFSHGDGRGAALTCNDKAAACHLACHVAITPGVPPLRERAHSFMPELGALGVQSVTSNLKKRLSSRLLSSHLSSPRHSSLFSSPLLCPPLSVSSVIPTELCLKGAGGSRGCAPRHTTFDSVRCLCSRLCGDTFFTYLTLPSLESRKKPRVRDAGSWVSL